MSLSRPKKVKIGPHWIKIEFFETVVADGSTVFGAFSNTESKIAISKNQSASMQADTLLHEIIHAIHYLMLGVVGDDGMNGLSEEQITTLTATNLLQVMKDNKKLIVWLQEQIK